MFSLIIYHQMKIEKRSVCNRRIFMGILFAVLGWSMQAKTTLQVTMGEEMGIDIRLCAVRQGYDSLCAMGRAGADGRATLEAQLPSAGYYELVNGSGVSYPVYLTDGQNLRVEFSTEGLRVLDKPDGLSGALCGYEQAYAPVALHAWLYRSVPGATSADSASFVKELKTLAAQRQAVEKALGKEPLDDSRRLVLLKMSCDEAFGKLAFFRSQGVDLMRPGEMAAYGRLFANDDVLRLPWASEMLKAYADVVSSERDWQADDYRDRARLFPSRALREAYLYAEAKGCRYYEQLETIRKSMGDDTLSLTFRHAVQPIEQRTAWSRPRQPATDFEGERVDGTRLRLSDLRGKVVVVDCWATWCVPCLRMMPHFEQLAEELKDKDVTFLSVCLGVSVEIDRWKALVKEHGLRGNVIFIPSWTKGMARDYHVSSVPRFMIISRDGTVFSYAAPAPTHPELKQMILQALGQ